MENKLIDASRRKTARLAGMLYLLMTIFGMFSMIYVDPKFYVPDNPTATVNSILASEGLFRLGIASSLVSIVLFLFVAYALYKLLKSVDKDLALLMIILVAVSIPVGLNFNQFAPILLSKSAGYRSAFGPAQLQALSMTFLDLQKQSDSIGQVFWGLWLFPLGRLVFKSGFIPKMLGILLMVGCFGYILNSLTILLFPDYKVISYLGSLFGFVAELVFIIWLLTKGVKSQNPATSEVD
jgi:Domain of unknown function (DUF4386)